jgi:hypothetical protein
MQSDFNEGHKTSARLPIQRGSKSVKQDESYERELNNDNSLKILNCSFVVTTRMY